MGNTQKVHNQNYARFIPDGISDKFAKTLGSRFVLNENILNIIKSI